MHFVKTEELKTGMRLARPIYNKKSILLFDRNSLLSVQAIEKHTQFRSDRCLCFRACGTATSHDAGGSGI